MLNVSLEHSFNLSNAVQVEVSQISQLEFYVYIASEVTVHFGGQSAMNKN